MKKLIILLGATVFLAACGSDSEPDVPAEPELTQETVTVAEPRREVRRAPEEPSQPLPTRSSEPAGDIPAVRGQAQTEGYGLTMLVDGSSPRAFEESLEMIASDATERQYHQLDSALRYLRAYAPEAWEGLPNLYKSLDGLSGEEIIELATEMQANRGRRPE